MAILINDPSAIKPKRFSQSKDPVLFVLKSTATQPWAGTKAKLRITFSSGVTPFTVLTLSSGVFEGLITGSFIFLSAPADTGWVLPSFVSGSMDVWIMNVAAAIKTNWYIANYYDVTYSSTYIDITAKNVGARYNFYGITSNSINMTASLIEPGSDAYFRDNMRLVFSIFSQSPTDAAPSLKHVTYSAPDPDTFNRHSVQEYLHNELAFDLDPFTVGLLSDRSAKWYANINEYYGSPAEHQQVVVYDGGDEGLFVYRGGSARLNTGDFDALVAQGGILKPYARSSQRAYIGTLCKYYASYVNLASISMNLMVIYELADSTGGFFELAEYLLPVYGAIYSTECSPYVIAQALTTLLSTPIHESDIVEYSLVPLFDGLPSLDMYTMRPVTETHQAQVFWFESSMGVTETVVANGDTELGIEVTKEDFRMMFPETNANSASRELYRRTDSFRFNGSASSGFVPMDELRDFWIDLLISENVWTHDEHGHIFRIHIDPDSYSLFRKDDALYSVSFSYVRTQFQKAHSAQ